MAASKVSDLTALAAAAAEGTDLLYIVDLSATTAGGKKTTLTDLLTLADSVAVKFGTGADIVMSWDGTRMNITQAATNSEIRWGVDGAGIDQILYGDTASVNVTWDQSADSLIFNDSALLVFGTGSDATLRWDGTDLDLLAAADDSVFKIGNGTNSFDLWLYGNSTSLYISWDASASDLKLEDSVSLMFGTGAGAGPGTAGDVEIRWDGTDLDVLGAADDLVITVGTGTNSFDLKWFGDTTSDFILYDASAKKLFINDTADTDMAIGLCINQLANDDAILTFKSSDVSHGMTDDWEADTYGGFQKFAGADGGLKMVGLSDATVAVEIFAASAVEDTTDAPSTTSIATITLNGAVKSSATFGALGATGNLLNVENLGTAEFVVKGDGELYSNQSATVGTFDDHDDAMMARDLSYALSNEYQKIVKHNVEMFEQLGILGPADERGGRMYSLTKLTMLTLCGLGQLGEQIKTLANHLGVKVAPNGGLVALEGGAA